MNAMSLAQMTGLSAGKKKASRGTRSRSGKPGAEHLGALQRAHASGDFKAAKIHALNYAKSAHQHSASESPEEHAELMADNEAAEPETMAPAPKANDARARLAKLAMSRKK